MPPEVPEPSATSHTTALTTSSSRTALTSRLPSSSAWMTAVARAEHADVEQAADADDHGADRRPPHPVDRQAVEAVLDAVEDEGKERGQEAGDQADHRGDRDRLDPGRRRRREREQRPGAEQKRAPGQRL